MKTKLRALTRKKRKHKDKAEKHAASCFLEAETDLEDTAKIELLDKDGKTIFTSLEKCDASQDGGKQLKVSEVFHPDVVGGLRGILSIKSSRDPFFNPPHVESLKLATNLLSGCPVLPKIDIRNGVISEVQYLWYVGSLKESNEVPDLKLEGNFPYFSLEGFEFRSSGFIFVPDDRDAGRNLCLVCIPGHDTVIRGVCHKSQIQATSEDYIWAGRQIICNSRHCSKDEIRVVSYNILADLYLDLKLEQDQLWFPYCPKEYQKAEYRYPLVLKEFEGYKADLFCLQEVDFKFFNRYLKCFMESLGFDGRFLIKGGEVNEGLVMFSRTQKLRILEQFEVLLADLLDISKSKYPQYADLIAVAEQSAEVVEILKTRPTVLQVILLAMASNNKLILVANTHLHYKPEHPHIRLLQIGLCTLHLESVLESLRSKHKEQEIGVIFSGDFNSGPRSGVVEFLTHGSLNCSHREWSAGNSETAEFFGMNLNTKLKFLNTCGCDFYTNYTKRSENEGFVGCLDYIWVESDKGSSLNYVTPVVKSGDL